MARASLDRAVDFARARMRTDGGLLATVALALIGVPAMLSQVIGATAVTKEVAVAGRAIEQLDLSPVQWLALAALTLALMLGQLTVARMLLVDGETVRRSLAVAGRRLVVLIAAQLLLVAVLVPLLLLAATALVLLAGLGAAGVGVATIGGIALLAALLIVAARLLFLVPSAADGALGVVGILKRSVSASKGLNGPLLLLLVLTTVVTLVAMGAAQALVGIPVALAAGPLAGQIAGAVAAGLVLALATLVTVALIVGMYREATSLDDGDLRSA